MSEYWSNDLNPAILTVCLLKANELVHAIEATCKQAGREEPNWLGAVRAEAALLKDEIKKQSEEKYAIHHRN